MLRVIVLLVALVAGGVAAWLSIGAQPGTAPGVAAPTPQIKTQEVLVAALDLPQGARLGESEIRWQTWPEDAVNPGFIRRSVRPEAIDELTGSFVRLPIIDGEPIRVEKLADETSGFLAARLPAGQRAVAVRVSAETAAGGFILPNDRVDVIHTFSQNNEAGLSRTILTSIRVLAIDQRSEDGGDDATAVGKTATLELDPAQVEVIAAAGSSGALSLALRSTADNTEAPALARLDEAPAPARQIVGAVRIVRAGQSERINTEGSVQ